MDKIEWEKIEVSGSRSGQKSTTCPECSHTRKKKKDKCLSVNFDLGMAYCNHCERVSFRDDNKQSEPVKEYLLPSQDWHNHTKLSDAMVKWCGKRMIKQNTLIHFGVTEEKQFMPQISKESNCIVFNYFEGGQVVNKKYRDGRKNFTQSKGGKPIFYNINSITGADRVYIVEGEFDVLAMYEAGIKNCISLPSGANDNDDYWHNSKPYIENVKEFVIAVDSDEKGKLIKEKIAHRLGKWRCKFIDWKGKDANDDLINGVIWESIKDEQRFPVSGTLKVSDLYDEVMNLYDKGEPDTYTVTHPSFGNFKNAFSVLPSQLTVITGVPQSGKSTFLEYFLTLFTEENNFKTSYFSPEHGDSSIHLTKFINSAIGKPFYGKNRVSKSDVKRYFDWAEEKIYFTKPEKGKKPTFDYILEVFKEQIYSYGINCFVIDAFNKCILPSGKSKIDAIGEVLTMMTDFCQQHNVMLFLVAHPTKMNDQTGKSRIPDLYDVSGSADFFNQTHNGFTIHRVLDKDSETGKGYTTFINQKTKFAQWQGERGKAVRFSYDVQSGRYYAQNCYPLMEDLTKEYKEKQKEIFDNDEEFGEETDCPF